ncbi:hypothetical protein K9M74_00140 [Candidatus Woesearchaeota archaeon]|nr:hypothetical protein [Candidatus Woesearchaeota archaeon]
MNTKTSKKGSFKERFIAFYSEQTKQHTFAKFSIVLLVILIYFIIISSHYGTKDGFLITALTWSFFVFCTPVADAGFLLDFPIRLITKLRMIYSEMVVWVIALILNVIVFFTNPGVYEKTFILSLFHHILSQPFPFWGIILLSGAGTFLSVYFADELLDVSTHKNREKYHRHVNKYQIILMLFLIVLIIIFYNFLLTKMGITIHL